MTTLGERLQKWRKKRGLKQTDVAKEIGVTQSTLSHLETKSDYFKNLEKYCELLNIELILKDKEQDENISIEENSTSKLEIVECRCRTKERPNQNQCDEWQRENESTISVELVVKQLH
jgi:transcriptional regulator with XRE-family HTH domain